MIVCTYGSNVQISVSLGKLVFLNINPAPAQEQ